MHTFSAEVSRIQDLTHDVRAIELRLLEPSSIAFKAGQFVSFEVPKEGQPRPVTRPYSIASPPGQRDRILLVLNLVQGGPGSSYLFGLREGERSVTLFWGLRSQRDLYWQEELTALAADHPNFSFVTTLSRPDPGWEGASGRVTALIDAQVSSVGNLAVYLCGGSGMIKDVTARLNAKGLCPIYREKYYD